MTSTAISNAAASTSITSGSHRAPQMQPYAAFPTDPSITGEQQPYHQTHNNHHHHHHHSNTTINSPPSSAPNPNVDPALDSPAAAASPPSHPLSADFDMAPPPPSTHPSFTALHAFAQSHAAQHGYALSINTTAKNRSRIKLACVCYGQAKNTHKLTPETRVRKNRQSCKTGCRMWVEGKRRDDGSWVLRVGEPAHNHEGRGVEGWAVQRKRTWGVSLGRIGVGGVTAREERAEEEAKRAMAAAMAQGQGQGQGRARSGGAEGARQMEGAEEDNDDDDDDDEGQEGGVREPQMQQEAPTQQQTQTHSHESGGLVWQIVEQEMARKGGPGQGRDRGVGRTVKVLQERLPGIRIFKRDVYNIRAQIKRARKQAGEEVGDGILDGGDINNNSNNNNDNSHLLEHPAAGGAQDQSNNVANRFPEIDPLLVAQCNDALRHVGAGAAGQEAEAERLRRENEELKVELAKRIKDAEEKAIENQRLKVELEMVKLEAMYNRQGTT